MLNKSIRATALAASATVGIMLLTGCAGRSINVPADRSVASAPVPSTASPSPVPTDTTVALAAFSSFVKGELKDGSASIQYVVTTAAPAEVAFYGSASHSSESDPALTPVVAMVAVGDFDGHDEKIPPGESPTTGKYITRVARLSDGAVMDWGITNTPPPLSELGTPLTSG